MATSEPEAVTVPEKSLAAPVTDTSPAAAEKAASFAFTVPSARIAPLDDTVRESVAVTEPAPVTSTPAGSPAW